MYALTCAYARVLVEYIADIEVCTYRVRVEMYYQRVLNDFKFCELDAGNRLHRFTASRPLERPRLFS